MHGLGLLTSANICVHSHTQHMIAYVHTYILCLMKVMLYKSYIIIIVATATTTATTTTTTTIELLLTNMYKLQYMHAR